jgi:hypothetical protein
MIQTYQPLRASTNAGTTPANRLLLKSLHNHTFESEKTGTKHSTAHSDCSCVARRNSVGMVPVSRLSFTALQRQR